MKKSYYIGIMSGTSMDGIDLVLADFGQEQIRTIASCEEQWPNELLEQMHRLCQPSDNEIDLVGVVGNEISRIFARGVDHLLQLAKVEPQEVVAIGCHGQTIRHRPQLGFSVQIGSGSLLAQLTGIDVICDFRSADIAASGQGAPLVPAFHHVMFRNPARLRFIVNIGGIANISVLDHDCPQVLGFDTGPGNTLMDALMRTIWQEKYDKDSQRARQGQLIPDLLDTLMEHPYLQEHWPKSTGRETFTWQWVEDMVKKQQVQSHANDLLRTLCRFTARSIALHINQIAHGRSYEVYICGGGVHNPLLMDDLKEELTDCSLLTSTWDLGVDPDFVEALAFAWLALRFTQRLPGNLMDATGASKPKILGCLYPAS